MAQVLSNAWWTVLLRGLVALIFGVVTLMRPAATIAFVIGMFAVYAAATGVSALIGAVYNRGKGGWSLLMLLGILNVAVGVIAVVNPAASAHALLIVVVVDVFFSGVLDLWMAIRMRREIRNEWLLGLAGVLSIVFACYFGTYLSMFPWASVLALLWLISVYAMAVGLVFVILGLRMCSFFNSMGLGAPG